tara:strand:+ start:844 stop:1842 length:999 start_codon:yes stop_codon:yes gene_type:complete
MKKRNFVRYFFLSLFLLFFRFLNAEKLLKNKYLLTKIMIDPIFLKHHISPNHPESPERIKFIDEAIKKNELIANVDTAHFSNDVIKWIKTIHSSKHINSISINHPIAHEVSLAGVKTCLSAVDSVMMRKVNNVFCAIRPPGHHALNTGKEEGFCYYNNIAITAKYLQKKFKINKILIVDWDYHHGNSTEYFFYDDPSILFFSTHDQFAYPGTGSPQKKGINDGLGYNFNVHLPCGTQDRDIINVFQKILVPNANKFEPEFVLISAGFDGKKNDPLGCFNLTDQGFIELTKIVLEISRKYSFGRVISILEGGYNLKENTSAAIAHVKTLNQTN